MRAPGPTSVVCVAKEASFNWQLFRHGRFAAEATFIFSAGQARLFGLYAPALPSRFAFFRIEVPVYFPILVFETPEWSY